MLKKCQAKVLGVVAETGDIRERLADGCVIIPTVKIRALLPPNTESFQSNYHGHLIVSHPRLIAAEMKWEIGK